MKIQKFVFNNNNPIFKIGTIPMFGIVFFLFACQNKIEDVNALLNPIDMPALHAHGMEIIRTDAGNIVFKAFAPEIIQHSNKKKYTEFPNGITVYTYNNYPEKESMLKANYAKFYEDRELWEARDSVVAENNKGETLNTDHLFWDQKRKILYSSNFTKITTEDGIFYGQNGFESDENFSKWKLINTKGTVNLKDE